jgi:hypothetical protein
MLRLLIVIVMGLILCMELFFTVGLHWSLIEKGVIWDG